MLRKLFEEQLVGDVPLWPPSSASVIYVKYYVASWRQDVWIWV